MKERTRAERVHLSKGGLPLCVCGSLRLNAEHIRYTLTLKFDEVTCKSCKAAITKLSRVQGFIRA